MTLVLAMIFFGMTPKAQITKAKMNKQDYMELKSFCAAKETVDKIKRQPTEYTCGCGGVCLQTIYSMGG